MTTGVLRNPDFVRFIGSHVANELGANISRVALPLVAVLVLHAGPAEVGLLTALQTAALLVIGLPAGVWVDRLRRRHVMMASDLTRCVLLAGIPLAAQFGLLSIGMMYAVALLVGMAQVFNDVADQTYLPDLVATEQLSDGNAKLEIVRSGAFMAGPGVGGVLVQTITAPFTILMTALGAFASVLLLGSIRAPDKPPAHSEPRPLLHDIGEGLAHVWRDRLLRAFAFSSAGTNLCVSAVVGLSVLFLSDVVRLPPTAIGILLMSGGVGGLVGGFSGAWLARRYGSARMTWLGFFAASPFGLLLPMTQADWRVSFFAITSMALSWGAVLSNIGQATYRQSTTPQHMLGRVNASVRFLVWGTMPLGALLGGLVAQQIGVRQALWVFMIGRLLSAVPLLFSPLPRMRDFSELRTRS
ncbi:MFS transporter [Nonomuraea pusilla]|uniref:Predicted arabinose efflux permease, MFS family n=1 Tax=Nonomuraea pusilla TaxID=46177 RepID=A0A1H7WBE7_9ACTN|nr:MFS transporter [Nonomuraea pusilla]SEM18674.1 Predicted arabinose efflux permease, MFS family [Nonomuraea pusilla]